MGWLELLLLVVKTLNQIFTYLQEKEKIDAMAAKITIDALAQAEKGIKDAKASRDALADALRAQPDKLRDDDGFKVP